VSGPDRDNDDVPVVELMPRGRVADGYVLYAAGSQYSRRSVIELALKLGAFLGLAMLGVFRPVRRAAADFPYQEHASCGSYDPDFWNGNDGNDNGWAEPGTCRDDACVGSSDDLMGWYLCTGCGEVSERSLIGWHAVGQRWAVSLGDTTDICSLGGVAKDAWRWSVANCPPCSPAVFRCHDGWKLFPDGTLSLSVCQALVACNGQPHNPC
jgi:hypothetical protein